MFDPLRSAEALAFRNIDPTTVTADWVVETLSPLTREACCVPYYEGTLTVLREALTRLSFYPMPEINHGYRRGLKPWFGDADLIVVQEATRWLVDSGSPLMVELNNELTVHVHELQLLSDAAHLSNEAAQRRIDNAARALLMVTRSPSYMYQVTMLYSNCDMEL